MNYGLDILLTFLGWLRLGRKGCGRSNEFADVRQPLFCASVLLDIPLLHVAIGLG